MANGDDDAVSAAQRKRNRTGRSQFPAANVYSNTAPAAVYGNPYSTGVGGGYRDMLPPELNPAYQAAINRPRPRLTTIQLPGGGTATVSASSAARTAGAVSGAYINPTGPLSTAQYQSAFARGYGAPAPSFNPATGTLSGGGVEAPLESLTPQQRIGYTGANPLQELFATRHPNLAAFGTLASNAFSGLFGGGGFTRPSSAFASTAGAAVPSPTPFQTPFPSATPTPTPFRRYSDPSPTPFSYMNQPRDYFQF